jgi:threonylcarbamoyladenosine tRNA methylthiotransferase MtaB
MTFSEKSAPEAGSPDIVTFGCRLNAFESQVIRANALAAGLENTIIFNTCAVTAEATRQARQAIRRSKRDNPQAHIIVTGCAAQINPDEFATMDEVNVVMGNSEKMNADSFAALASRPDHKVLVDDIMTIKETAGHLVDGFDGRARAFVQIQNGCDHRCTFCIIPYGRGNSRSIAVGEVIRQIQLLVDNGYGEVVLTGVDITSYGPDLPGKPSLGQLVLKILKMVPALERLRLSSIDSIEIDDALFEAITGEPRLMPHLHLSLQSGDDMILKRMKRRHNRDHSIEFTCRVLEARPDMVFGADIITGFPTESEEMFENTLKLVDDCNLTFLHVFPYSARKGTPAARMPQIKKTVRKDRARRLRAKGAITQARLFGQMVGKSTNVLIEKPIGDDASFGHGENFAPVELKGCYEAGAIIKARIVSAEDTLLKGIELDG